MYRIHYLGPAGTNGHRAAVEFACRYGVKLGGDYIVMSAASHRDLLLKAGSGEQDLAVLPVRNSTVGLINETTQLLWASGEPRLTIWGKVDLRVHYSLFADRSVKDLSTITTVASHWEALRQCQQSLYAISEGREQPLRIMLASSTAWGIKGLQSGELDRSIAVLAPLTNAEVTPKHDRVAMIREGLEDQTDNFTRFFLFGPNLPSGPVIVGERSATALLFQVANRSRSLDAALHCLTPNISWLGLLPGPQEDRCTFYLEVAADAASEPLKEELCRLTRVTKKLLVLGSY